MNDRGLTEPPPGIPAVMLRAEPDLKSAAAGEVPRGTELDVLGVSADGRFYRVRYKDKEAWLHRDVFRVGAAAQPGCTDPPDRKCDVIYGGTDCVMFCESDADCTKCGYGLRRCAIDTELHPTRKTCGVKP